MIEFKGEISKACRKYIFWRYIKSSLFPALLVFILIGIPVIHFITTQLALPGWFIPIAIVCVLAMGVIPMVPSKKDLNKSIIATRMTIVDGEITVYGQKFEECMLVENVTKVFDMGEWYHISFGIIRDQGRMVCQKDLIVKGTIEEFEALFDGKIIRK